MVLSDLRCCIYWWKRTWHWGGPERSGDKGGPSPASSLVPAWLQLPFQGLPGASPPMDHFPYSVWFCWMSAQQRTDFPGAHSAIPIPDNITWPLWDLHFPTRSDRCVVGGRRRWEKGLVGPERKVFAKRPSVPELWSDSNLSSWSCFSALTWQRWGKRILESWDEGAGLKLAMSLKHFKACD